MSSITLRTSLAVLALGIGISYFAKPTHAMSIVSSPVAPSPSTIGNGLNGTYWKANANVLNIRNLAEAEAVMNSQPPTATFISRLVDYPNGTSGTVSNGALLPDLTPNTIGLTNYLGIDAPSLIGTAPSDLTRSVFRFSGFINILDEFDIDRSTTDIDVDFFVSSDDGFQLTIGGTLLSSSGRRFGGTTPARASFSAPGLYELELIHFEDRIYTGLEFASSLSTLPRDIVPTDVLYTSSSPTAVPTPAPLLGLIGMGVAAIRKRQRVDV